MSGYTAGPWEARQHKNLSWEVFAGKHEMATELTEANARLIAAAPIMFAALQRILGLQQEHDGEDFEAVVLHAEELSRSAIATAKGGAE